MLQRAFLVAFLALLPTLAAAQPASVPTPFRPVLFLIGDWSGDGSADVGKGTGADSFHFDVGNRVIVRRSHATYTSADGKVTSYQSLMVIYNDAASSQLRADYYDDGGHVIHYTFVPSADSQVAQFLSDAVSGAPRFRLTYRSRAGGTLLAVKFELAPPGSDAFATLAEGVMSKTATK
jgi:hypothetical protein